jgi:hypothetical protein
VSTAGGDGLTVLVAAVAAASVCAMVGWRLAAAHADDAVAGTRTIARPEFSRVGVMIVVATSAVGIVVSPVIGVFWLWVALNHLLGTGENAPFSRYPMFAEPSERTWALRYETSEGAPLNLVHLGIQPAAARKRFSKVLLSAHTETGDRSAARRQAAEVIGDWITTRRPGSGPLASEPISIVLIDYVFDGQTIVTERHLLTVVAPA